MFIDNPGKRLESQASHLAPHRNRILVVEDDVMVAQLLLDLLDDSGFVTRYAETADSALLMLEGARIMPDLVLSDVVMPGSLSGVSLGTIIRQRWPSIPVLLMTGYAFGDPRLGNFPVVRKPYSFDALILKMREMLEDAALAAA